ncbi:MAG TPA: copper chaperone PCu(A)C [Hyphomicrobiales bacterium]|nr:copper chaperone PCu(A)C [Hyphomicrobiales bacterium]
MKKAVIVLGAALLAAGVANAHDYKAGSIIVGHPWARPTPPGAKAAAAYFTLQNTGSAPDTLMSVSSPVDESAQLHQTIRDGEVMKMREVKGGVAIPPGATVKFEPGGYHVMLLQPKQQFEEGQFFPLTLTFAKAGTVNVEVKVEKQPGERPVAGASHGGMEHMH